MSAKSPVIVDLKFIPEEVEAALAGAFPDREVIDLADPNLKVVFSGSACGAGVDHPLTLPGLPDVGSTATSSTRHIPQNKNAPLPPVRR